ncbi:MAG: hypothetical protein Q4C46_02255 [Bacillota bacterium]|nr:hypothetical protein [Bacillota bacterium]
MFRDTRRKRLRSRILYLSLAAAVLAFGIWMNYNDNDRQDKAAYPAEAVGADTEVKESESTDRVEESQDTGTDTQEIPKSYLIKEVDGVVKVFLCDEKGSKELYLITSIPFDLLSESDQKLFADGVSLETEDDLGAFLQNFDS